MKVLISGGTSSVAKAIISEMNEIATIYTAGRKNCDFYFDLSSSNNEINFNTIKPDILIHTAANFGGNSFNEIFNAEYENVLGTLKICEAAVKAKVKHFIFISSIYAELKEGDNNYNIYAISKKHAEEVALLYCKNNNLPITILRPTLLYGSIENLRKNQPLIYHFIDKALKNEDIEIYGSNDVLRNYLHLEDLAIIIKKVIEKNVLGTFSVLNIENNKISQIAEAIKIAFKSQSNIFFNKNKPNIFENEINMNTDLYNLINYKPLINIELGMKKIAESRRNNNV